MRGAASNVRPYRDPFLLSIVATPRFGVEQKGVRTDFRSFRANGQRVLFNHVFIGPRHNLRGYFLRLNLCLRARRPRRPFQPAVGALKYPTAGKLLGKLHLTL